MKTIPVPSIIALLTLIAGSAFAAEVSLESAPPVVVRTAPVAGVTNVDPALSEIRVTFSKRMQDGTWSWSTCGEEHFPATAGQPRYLADQRTCVLPVRLEPLRFYAIWINSDKFKGFKDATGRPAVPYLLTFNTAAAAVAPATPAAAVEEVARKFAAAIADRNDQELKALSCDSLTKGWTDAVPHFADELRNAVTHFGAGFDVFAQIEEVLVEDDLAAVKTAHLPLKKAYLVLFFHKTPDGWRNSSLRNSPDSKPLSEHFQKFVAEAQGKPTRGQGSAAQPQPDLITGLNDDQRAVLAWTDRQFRNFFDARTFDGWSADERAALERRLIDTLNGPRSTDYYQAINTLAVLRSTNALPRLREIAFERVDRDNRDRWMAIRALGIIGDKSAVPELIHLVYHGNVNTRWWAQISLVRLTGQNFAKDWNAWGGWWNKQNAQPPFKPDIIRWWNGQPEPDKLAVSLDEGDRNFLDKLRTSGAPR